MKNKERKINNVSISRKNSGFTLVELLVCFAILSVVALCVSVMMNAGTNMYVRVSKSISLSNKTQIALVQLKEYFIDCDEIFFDENADVYIFDRDSDEGVCCLSFDEAEKKLIYCPCDVIPGYDNPSISKRTDDAQPLVKDISELEFSFDDEELPTMVSVKITASIGQTQYSKNQNFYMRNKPILSESIDTFAMRVSNQGGTD